MLDQAATCPCVAFWPGVGEAVVVLDAVANSHDRPVLDRLVAALRIEIPIAGDHPRPAYGGHSPLRLQ